MTRRFIGGASDANVPTLTTGLANKAYVDLSRMNTADPLYKWHRNLAKKNSRNVNVLMLGDSIPYGQGLSVQTPPDMSNYGEWMGQQLQFLLNGVQNTGRKNYINDALGDLTTYPNPAAGGYCVRPSYCNAGGFADPWKLISGSITYQTRGIGMKVLQLNASTRIAHTAEACTGMMIYYEDGASPTGQLAFSIYGGEYDANRPMKWAENAAIPQNTALPQFSTGLVQQQFPARGKYTVEFSNTSGTAVLSMLHIVDGDLTRGVKVWNGAYGATLSGDWAANNTAANSAATSSAKLEGFDTGQGMDLIVMYLGANDYANNVVPATFQTNLETIITKYRVSNPRAAFLIVSHFARYDVVGPTYAWPLYQQAMQNVTTTRTETDYLDLSPYFPASQAADTDDDLVDSTGVHLTNHGQAWAAQLIASKLAIPGVV